MKRERFLKTVMSCEEKHNYARAVFIWVCACVCVSVSREWSALGWICPRCFDISWPEPSRPWQSRVLGSSLPFNAYWIQIIFEGSAEFSIGRSDPLTIYKLEFTRKRKSEVMVRVWSLRRCIQRKKTFGPLQHTWIKCIWFMHQVSGRILHLHSGYSSWQRLLQSRCLQALCHKVCSSLHVLQCLF